MRRLLDADQDEAPDRQGRTFSAWPDDDFTEEGGADDMDFTALGGSLKKCFEWEP